MDSRDTRGLQRDYTGLKQLYLKLSHTHSRRTEWHLYENFFQGRALAGEKNDDKVVYTAIATLAMAASMLAICVLQKPTSCSWAC